MGHARVPAAEPVAVGVPVPEGGGVPGGVPVELLVTVPVALDVVEPVAVGGGVPVELLVSVLVAVGVPVPVGGGVPVALDEPVGPGDGVRVLLLDTPMGAAPVGTMNAIS
jgi:hypothetical protein